MQNAIATINPHIYKFELLGTPEDVSRVREGLEQFWQKTTPTQA